LSAYQGAKPENVRGAPLNEIARNVLSASIPRSKSDKESLWTVDQGSVSDFDVSEVFAAKKRLDFDENSSSTQNLVNSVSTYAQGQARRQESKLKKKVSPLSGDSSSSISFS